MQRLTLMMAYLSDKPIVILDEPTAGQDAESLERCAELIREMRKEKTVLIITHDPELIAGACDRCIGLSDGHAEIELPGSFGTRFASSPAIYGGLSSFRCSGEKTA